MFEIEFRARFDSKKYAALKTYLDSHAQSLGEDNKDCYYYIFPDKLLKLVNNISKKTAKVSLKLNRIGEGAAFPEIEFYIPPDQFDTATQLLANLSLPAAVMHDSQQRVNYSYKDCEIALKYSKAWGYHLEIEQLIEDKGKQIEAEAHIKEVANELDVQLMFEEELKAFTHRAEMKK